MVKNKVAPPFRQARFDVMYDSGISREGGILDMGTTLGIVKKAGTWYSYGRSASGRAARTPRPFSRSTPRSRVRSSRRVKLAAGIITEEKPAEEAAKA